MSGILKANVNANFRIGYGSLIVVLLCGSAFLQYINIAYADKYYYLAFIIALILGTANVKIIHNRFNLGAPDRFTKGLVLTSILLVISITVTGILYFILKLNFNFLTFLLAFLIPYFIDGVYTNYLLIPHSEYKLSYYPFDRQFPEISSIDFSDTLVIQFVLRKDSEDNAQTSFSSRAPLDMPVSELFFTFIYEYNKKKPSQIIQFTNKANEPYSWLFYTKKGIFTNNEFLDPDLSFRENAVSPNQNIYAIRKTQD